MKTDDIVSAQKINSILADAANPSEEEAIKIVRRARHEKKGLAPAEVALLSNASGERFEKELFDAASSVKSEIYGERLVFFAPLYISDVCVNDCEYCSFHARNSATPRCSLAMHEIKKQTEVIIGMGHKRILLECGESPLTPIDYVVEAIKNIYSVSTPKGSIRRLNVNVPATTTENYRRLKAAGIGTYQLFQETYHPETYSRVHPRGPKSDYERQITAHMRAFEAGIDDVGMGVLFGLYDWRFEITALVLHASYLEFRYGVGPHTISVPRWRPAGGVDYKPSYPVSDEDFLKIIAILRLAVPYTGMIISTRERPELRNISFKIGISQASAASVTSVGGYKSENISERKNRVADGQFLISDERPLEDVIEAALADGLIPSFCTACYRRGRTGEKFMEIARPAEIHNFCRPNGILTFAEYLEDFASDNEELRSKGWAVIEKLLDSIDDAAIRAKTRNMLAVIKKGGRDIFF